MGFSEILEHHPDDRAEIKQLRTLLVRVLRAADSGHWRDNTGLSFSAHPLVDEIRGKISDAVRRKIAEDIEEQFIKDEAGR